MAAAAAADKKVTAVIFTYSDGTAEFATGDHATEVMAWLNGCQMMSFVHGDQYTGQRMIEGDVAAAKAALESVEVA